MSEKGWFKIDRAVFDNPVVMKDVEHLAIWIYLIGHASHKKHDTVLGKERITLLPGQLIIGIRKLSSELTVNKSKVERVLKDFKNETMIETLGTGSGTLVSIVNWFVYQNVETPIETQVRHERDTGETQVRHIQELKNDKNDENVFVSKEEEEEIRARARANHIDSGWQNGTYWNPWTDQWETVPSQEEIDRRLNAMRARRGGK